MSVLPNNWVNCRVSDLAQLIRGVTYKSADATKKPGPGFVPLLRANNIGGRVNYDDLVYVREGRVSDAQWLQEGDVLIAMSSGSTNLVGKAAQVTGAGRSTFGAFCGTLRPTPDIDQRFFGWFFQTQAYRARISGEARGSNINNLKRNNILGLYFPLPPLNEQRRIVEKIETLFAELDQGEAALRKVQTLLARYRQSALKAAFSGQLTAAWRAENAHRLEHGRDLLERILQARRENWQGRGKYKEPDAPDPADLPELPEGWVWASTEQLAYVETGATPKKTNPDYYASVGTPWITSTAVNEDVITSPQAYITDVALRQTNAKIFPIGSLIIALYGEGKTRGKVSQLGIDAATNQACAALIVGHLPQHMKQYLKLFYQYNYDNIRLLSSGGVQPNLNLGVIKSTCVPLPPLSEIYEVINQVEIEMRGIEVVADICLSELARSAALRQSILKDAFAGRLVPQDPNDEPADKLLARIRAAHEAASKKTTRKKAKA